MGLDRMDGHRGQIDPAGGFLRRWWCLAALAGTLVAVGGRLELIREYGTSLPFRDQWKCTAADLLGPWVEGRLQTSAFFAPLNDHWVVLTRLLSYGLARLNGQWNNLLEISVNALIHGAAVWLFLGAISPSLGRRLGAVFGLFAGFVLCLPYTWENSLWGIQSLVYFQVGLSVAYLWAVGTRQQFTVSWWLGQLAGGLVLFTQHSGVLAYAAATPLLLWRLWRRDGDRRVILANLALAGIWASLYFVLVPPLTVTGYLRADSWRIALDVCLRQLGWPLPHPGWAFFFYLPFLGFAIDRWARRRLDGSEAFIVAVGLWVGAQAAAIGYGRGGDTVGFVSRYCDFLALGFLVNAACLARLWRTTSARWLRTGIGLLAAAWIGASIPGLWHESVASHAGYNLERRPTVNAQNLGAVRGFIVTGDPAYLAQDKIGDILYSYPPTLVELLRQPRFRALLPPETGAPEARPDYGRVGIVARLLPAAGRWIILGGVLLWLAASQQLWTPVSRIAAPLVAAESGWTRPAFFLAWSVATALAAVAWLAWPQPFAFNEQLRWQAAYAPDSPAVEFVDPIFLIDKGPRIQPAELRGAVATEPAAVRPYWYGTLLGGYEFTGIVRSAPVAVRHRYFFTPVSGWPNWPGNAIRWRFENPVSGEVQWRAVSCPPTEPREAVEMWTEDVAAFQGWKASLYLFDGHADEHGWVGAARPATTDDPDFGRRWLAELHAERAEPTHVVVVFLALTALAAWIIQAVRLHRHWRSIQPRSANTAG
jgi:hypothetical protein